MRTFLLVLSALSVALAGCTNADEGDGGSTTTTPTTDTGGDGAAAVNETITHDFTQQATTKTFTVANGTTGELNITITFASNVPAAPTCQGGTATVVVKDPEGTEVARAEAGTTGVGPCGGENVPDAPIVGGDWTVEFTGTGAVTATVTVTSE